MKVDNIKTFCIGTAFLFTGTAAGTAILIGYALMRDLHTDTVFGMLILCLVLIVSGAFLVAGPPKP